jgi:nitroreductase
MLPADEAIRTRRSVRAFLPTPVPRESVEALLALASRSPSGTNIQPWKVRAVAGEVRDRLSAAILGALDRDGHGAHQREWNYYPVNWREPYLARRRKIGWDLYGLLGIRKGDFEGTERQRRRNYEFFGAPVGMIFTIERVMQQGSWLDYGMFLQNIMVAARARGLDTCPQAAFTQFHRVIAEVLGLPVAEMVVCGMSLGHADPDAVENQLVTEREPVQGFVRYYD